MNSLKLSGIKYFMMTHLNFVDVHLQTINCSYKCPAVKPFTINVCILLSYVMFCH